MSRRNGHYVEFREFYSQDSSLDPIPASSVRLYVHDEFVDLWRQVMEAFARYQQWSDQRPSDAPTCYAIRFTIPRSWYRVSGAGNLNIRASLEFEPTGIGLILVAPDDDEYGVTETEFVSYEQLPLPQGTPLQ